MTSCVSSSIDITAAREGTRYIPAHEILKINDATLAIPIDGQRLIPDQLFALDYGGSFRVFALEIDRGTEPKTSASARKSYAKSIEQYRELIKRQLHKSHYGLKAPLLVLWVFSSHTNEMRFMEMVSKIGGPFPKLVLTQSFQDQNQRGLTGSPLSNLFSGRWNRAIDKPVRIAKSE